MQQVHVFIVNYNSAVHLRDCLETLRHEPIAWFHIVDNFCRPSERDSLTRIAASFPNMSVTFSESNLGFGPALNLAIGNAELRPDDIIWMLNPDTRVTPGAVDALVAFMQTGYDIVSPNILTGSADCPRVWFSGGVLDKKQVRTRHIGLGAIWDEGQSSQSSREDTTFITGAAMMMACSTWNKIGGFREGFFLYWEDAELSERAVSMNYRLGVAASASIWHAVGGSGSSSGMSPAYYYYMQRNRLWFGRQWMTRRNILFGSGLRETLALTLRPLKEKRGRVSKTISSFRGLVHGSIHKPL